jgi:hypothetical protein
LFERRRDTQQQDFDSVLVRPPSSLASWVRKPFNLDMRNRFVVAYRGLAGAVARSCVAGLLCSLRARQ